MKQKYAMTLKSCRDSFQSILMVNNIIFNFRLIAKKYLFLQKVGEKLVLLSLLKAIFKIHDSDFFWLKMQFLFNIE